MVETTIQRARSIATTDAPAAQWSRGRYGETTLLTNFYGSDFGGITPSDYILWKSRSEGNEGTGNPGWRNREKILEATLKYILNTNSNSRVYAFPSMLWGTLGGRDETTGFIRGLLNQVAGIPASSRRMLGTGLESNVWDLSVSQALVGFPCRADALPSTKLHFKVSRDTPGLENLFIDLYYDDVTDTTIYNIADSGGAPLASTRLPHASLANTINGTNYHRTRAWNLPLWPALPVEANGGSTRVDGGWAGGQILTDVGQITIDGRQHWLVMKRENAGTWFEFDYLGLIFVNQEFEGTIDISAYNNWFLTQAWGLIQSSPIALGVFNAARIKPWGAPRQPAGDMIFQCVNYGSEVWKSPASGLEASITYQRAELEVAGVGTFGIGASGDTPGTGTDLNYSKTVTVGNSLTIPANEINDSASPVVSFTDTDSTVTSVLDLDPFKIRIDKDGVNTIVVTLANGGKGTIAITAVPASNVQPDYGVRRIRPGQARQIDVSELPGLSSLTVRNLLSSSGPFQFTFNDPILTVTASAIANDGDTGEATVGNNGN